MSVDKEFRKVELPLARQAMEAAGFYLAGERDLDRLAKVSADAFRDYPLHKWFCGGQYDEKTSRLIMRTTYKAMMKGALIYADCPEINGIAAWLPIDFGGSEPLSFLRNGGVELLLHAGPSIVPRLLGYEKLAMALKARYTQGAGWYLYSLTVSPAAQGQGLATRLLRPMLDFCDREKMTCYLETNKESNVSLYQHFGFELAEQRQIPKSEVMHYAMMRRAQSL